MDSSADGAATDGWIVHLFDGGVHYSHAHGYVNDTTGKQIYAQIKYQNDQYGEIKACSSVTEGKEWVIARMIAKMVLRRLTGKS